LPPSGAIERRQEVKEKKDKKERIRGAPLLHRVQVSSISSNGGHVRKDRQPVQKEEKHTSKGGGVQGRRSHEKVCCYKEDQKPALRKAPAALVGNRRKSEATKVESK